MVGSMQNLAAMNGLQTMLIMIGAIVFGGLLLILLIALAVRALLRRLRRSLPVDLINQLKQDIDSGDYGRRLQEPASLSGMERIYGPQIRADFPELNLEELKRRAERLAHSTLDAINEENPAALTEDSELYKAQVSQHLTGLQSLGQHEHYAAVTIHRIVLSHYQKSGGTCRISFQLAVGADYRKTGEDGQVVAGHDGASQFKMEIDALYIQDGDLLDSREIEALAFHCPNCGAPVPSLGDRRCQYCGSAVEPVNVKVWTFCSFQILLT